MTYPSPQWQTGQQHLRPLTVADFLDNSFRLLRQNLRNFVVLALLVALPGAVVATVLSAIRGDDVAVDSLIDLLQSGDFAAYAETQETSPFTTAELQGALIGLALALVLSVFVTPLIIGAMARSGASTWSGRPEKATTSLGVIARDWTWLKLIVASLLVRSIWIVYFGLNALVLLGAFLIDPAALAVATVLSVLAAFVIVPLVALVYGIWWTLVIPAVVLEKAGPITAVRRSMKLVTPRFFWYLLIILLVRLLLWVITVVLGVVMSIFQGLASVADLAPLVWAVTGLGSLLDTLVTAPVVTILAVLMYYDARVRREGLDLQMTTAAPAWYGVAPAGPPATGPQPGQGQYGQPPVAVDPFATDPFATDPFAGGSQGAGPGFRP